MVDFPSPSRWHACTIHVATPRKWSRFSGQPASAVGRRLCWCAVALCFLAQQAPGELASPADLPPCAPWRGERTYAVDLDTIDVFVVLDFPRTTPEVVVAVSPGPACDPLLFPCADIAARVRPLGPFRWWLQR
jgi:hypothetical protein